MQKLIGLLIVVAAAGCAEPQENPQVVARDTSCGPAARLVTDVCTELGGDDGCVEVDDVCIALCDQVQSCTDVDPQLRVLGSWPVAPNGYCVVCRD